MARRLPLLLCLLCVPLLAQGPTTPEEDDTYTPDSYIGLTIHPTGLGNVRIEALAVGGTVLTDIPAALNCDWRETVRAKYIVAGTCRGWLRGNGAGRLSLAPVAAALLDRGAPTVELNLKGLSRDVDIPEGWQSSRYRRDSFASFTAKPGFLPPDISIPLDPPPNLITPTAVVLLAPVVLAFFVRRNLSSQADKKMNQVVWTNWSTLAVWLYWISVVNPSAFTDYLELALPLPTVPNVALSVLFFTLPPLISMAGCLIAMAPLLSSSGESFKRLLVRQMTAQASFQVPLAIFYVGAGASGVMLLGSLVAAYLVFRGFRYLVWHMSYAEIAPLESGELFERATALARKAGVPILRFGMLRTKMPEEVNAFAMTGNRIIVTESLVRGMTPREVDAVIAHELGHHKHGHTSWFSSGLLFWICFLVAGPVLGWLIGRLSAPRWILDVPILPLAFIMLQGLTSRRKELTADARAAEITGDPEGTIAALGRLAQLSRVPVEAKGMMESILSHPSMERRVLALAARTGLAPERALEILRDPNAAYSDPLANLALALKTALPPPPPEQKPVFALKQRAIYLEKAGWLQLLLPIATTLAIAFAFDKLILDGSQGSPFWWLLGLSFGAPFLILAVQLAGQVWIGRRFSNGIRTKLAERLNPPPEAIFVGIHPGSGMRLTEGFWDWDFGFLTIQDEWLCYRGEKTRFAIAKKDMGPISVIEGPPAWMRELRLEVLYPGGAFTFTMDFAFPTKAETGRMLERLHGWLFEDAGNTTARPEPPPLLPRLPGASTTRRNAIWFAAKTTLKLWLVAPLMYYIGWSPYDSTLLMFAAPLAVCLYAAPRILWPIRPPAVTHAMPPKLPEPAEPVLQ